MFSAKEYQLLTGKLSNDYKYSRIVDRFERMDYVVRKRGALLRDYTEKVRKLCRAHEHEHRKSEQRAQSHLEQARQLIQKPKEFEKCVQEWNLALRWLPHDWSSWTQMVKFAIIYLERAQHYFQHEMFDECYWDVKHASGVFDLCHAKATGSACLMARITALKIHLVDQLQIDLWTSIRNVLERFHLAEVLQHIPRPNLDLMTSQLATLDFDTLFELSHSLDHELNEFEEDRRLIEGDGFSLRLQLENRVVQLEQSNESGRFYVAGKHLYEGEVVMREKPCATVLFEGHALQNCGNCHRAIPCFWPCHQCTELGFCSPNCARTAYDSFHFAECGLYGLIVGKENYYSLTHAFRLAATFGLAALIEAEESNPGAEDIENYVASCDIRNKPLCQLESEDRKKVIRALVALVHHRGQRDSIRENYQTISGFVLLELLAHRGLVSRKSFEDRKWLARTTEHLATMMLRICTNGFCWAEERKVETSSSSNVVKLGSCICIAASFFNHSCDPNVTWEITEFGIKLSAMRAIRPGEPLTICYGPKKWTPFIERIRRLRDDYCFFCRCTVCRTDSAKADSLKCLATSNCPGPLLLNQYEACHTCGRKAPLPIMAHQWKQEINHYGRKLTKKIKEIQYGKTRLMLSCLKKGNTKRKAYQLPSTFDGPRIPISNRKVGQLEKYFSKVECRIYPGSYRMLELISIMLYAYHRAGLEGRGLVMMDSIGKCVDEVVPEMIDWESTGVIYRLDFIARFFDHFANRSLVSPRGRKSFSYAQFWTQLYRVNLKLLDILRHDLHHRGLFFPVLHKRVKCTTDWTDGCLGDSNSLSTAPPRLSADEQRFKAIYETCQGRIDAIEYELNHN